jgi:hypothetical protein
MSAGIFEIEALLIPEAFFAVEGRAGDKLVFFLLLVRISGSEFVYERDFMCSSGCRLKFGDGKIVTIPDIEVLEI